MADLNYPSFGQQKPFGVPNNGMDVIINSPHHHFALSQLPFIKKRVDADVTAITGGTGLTLSITRISRR